MKKTNLHFILLFLFFVVCRYSYSTPSTQIWIPSTDFQKYGTFHIGIDNYIRAYNQENTRGAGMYDAGLTVGVLPFKKLQCEIGVDYLSMGDGIYDKHPLFFNLKLGSAEDSLFKGCPGIVIGAYNFGTKAKLTDYNIVYGLLSKTIPVIGRLSAGYYMGNKKLLLDDKGKEAESGVLVSLDRQMKEISDKLWVALDYQGGESYLGAFSFGVSWMFSSNVSVILGYNIYNNPKTYYNSKDLNVNTFTTQLDINF